MGQLRRSIVLIIEDDESILNLLSDVFGEEGWEVRCATNGADGLASMLARRPDVIIVDVMMPVMDGWQFRAAQARLDGYSSIPAVIISASPRPSRAQLGTATFVAKPFEVNDVVAAVRGAAPLH